MRHDIRNNLQVIQTYAGVLEEHVDDEGAEYLETIEKNTDEAVGLTITAGELSKLLLREDDESRQIPLDQLLEQQIDKQRSSHRDAVLAVEGQLPDVDVYGDELLPSVFRNLIENAVVHNDTSPPRVVVSATVEGETAEVRVADNGPGIPDAQKEDIFGKGEKGLESPGSGIGLYLVQSIVDATGGSVWVEDNDPEGAVFVVELPVAD